MVQKSDEKNRAILLRQKGFSYGEILSEIPVAKSTLSLWLRSVGLSRQNQQRLTTKRVEASKRGGIARRIQKERITALIKNKAKSEVHSITKRELLLIGACLYWGEGSKEKEYAPGLGLVFTNSDVAMIRVYLIWLQKICDVKQSNIKYELYIHETNKNSRESMVRFWEDQLDLEVGSIGKVYVKHNKIATQRRNTGVLYNGTVRIKVAKSSGLNRQVSGWIEGIASAVK